MTPAVCNILSLFFSFFSGDKSKADHYFKAYVALAANCQTHNLPHGEDELLVGRAGYLCGVLWLEKVFGKGSFPAKDIDEICKCVIESGRNYARRHRSPCPLMYSYYDTEYLGRLIFTFSCAVIRNAKKSIL